MDWTQLSNWLSGEWLLKISSRVLVATVVFLFFVIAGSIAKAIVVRIHRMRADEQRSLLILGIVAKYSIMVGGMIVALSVLGINAVALTTGLGAAGVILGIALQGYLSDVFSGFFIVFNHVFAVGDIITVDGITGRVQSISLRATILSAESRRVTVPNSLVAKSAVSVHLQE